MSAPGFLVTGSGRCGTGFIARVLRKAGLNVGHEDWWGLRRREPVPNLDGDASWLGCFDDGFRGPVYALVRDPVEAIPSIYASEHRRPWFVVRQQNVELSGEWAVDAARIWLAYNLKALERAEAWWRVEDLSAAALAVLGVDAGAALETVPRNVNRRRRLDYPWPSDPVIDEALALARDLGYSKEPQ